MGESKNQGISIKEVQFYPIETAILKEHHEQPNIRTLRLTPPGIQLWGQTPQKVNNNYIFFFDFNFGISTFTLLKQ